MKLELIEVWVNDELLKAAIVYHSRNSSTAMCATSRVMFLKAAYEWLSIEIPGYEWNLFSSKSHNENIIGIDYANEKFIEQHFATIESLIIELLETPDLWLVGNENNEKIHRS